MLRLWTPRRDIHTKVFWFWVRGRVFFMSTFRCSKDLGSSITLSNYGNRPWVSTTPQCQLRLERVPASLRNVASHFSMAWGRIMGFVPLYHLQYLYCLWYWSLYSKMRNAKLSSLQLGTAYHFWYALGYIHTLHTTFLESYLPHPYFAGGEFFLENRP